MAVTDWKETDWKEREKENNGERADRGDQKKSFQIPAVVGKRSQLAGDRGITEGITEGIAGGIAEGIAGGIDNHDCANGNSEGVYKIDADSIIGTFSLAAIRYMFDTHLAEDTRYIRTRHEVF